MSLTMQLAPCSRGLLPLLALLLVILSGCQRAGQPGPLPSEPEGSLPSPTMVNGAAPVETDPAGAIMLSPLPTEGDAIITGRLVDAQTGALLMGTAVQLAPVYWTSRGTDAPEGSFILNTAQAPFTVSDEEGYFRFDSLADGDYVMIVGDITMNYMIVTTPEGENQVITASAAEATDVGDIVVTWQSGEP